jgi:acetolactate synthase-1/3 small subunit
LSKIEVTMPTKKPSARTFVATVEDRPGVLNRVVSLIRRRGYNIDSLAVGATESPAVSRITLVVRADEDTARRVRASLLKLVDVLRVDDVTGAPSVIHELALIKVYAPAEQRNEVLRISEAFRARIVDLSPATVVLEVTGGQDRIEGLLEVLKPFGVAEVVRTGAIAMLRGGEAKVSIPGSQVEEVAA